MILTNQPTTSRPWPPSWRWSPPSTLTRCTPTRGWPAGYSVMTELLYQEQAPCYEVQRKTKYRNYLEAWYNINIYPHTNSYMQWNKQFQQIFSLTGTYYEVKTYHDMYGVIHNEHWELYISNSNTVGCLTVPDSCWVIGIFFCFCIVIAVVYGGRDVFHPTQPWGCCCSSP